MGVHFVFDAGVVPAAELEERIVLQRSELDDWMLVGDDQAHLLSPWGEQRALRAMAVLRGEAQPDLLSWEG